MARHVLSGKLPMMLLSLIYLLVNILCLLVLLSKQYYKLWPACVAMQAVTSWQIGVSLFVPRSAPDQAVSLWIVGECVLLAATTMAVGEAVWKSLRQMSAVNKVMTIGGLALFSGSVAMIVYGDEPARIWPRSFFMLREQFFLGIALASFIALWLGIMHYRGWPRAARMQLAMYTALLCGHVLVIDWSHWQASRTAYRILETLCCVGFVINSNFLAAEIGVVQKSLRGSSSWPNLSSSPRIPAFRIDRLPLALNRQIAAPIARALPVVHRRA